MTRMSTLVSRAPAFIAIVAGLALAHDACQAADGSDVSISVSSNGWLGIADNDWFNPANWSLGLLFGLPHTTKPTLISVSQQSRNGVLTNIFDFPVREAGLSGVFSTPRFDMMAWDGLSQLRLSQGAVLNASQAQIGRSFDGPAPGYFPSGAVLPATIYLDGGVTTGSWQFLPNSRVVVNSPYSYAQSGWYGQLGSLQVNTNGSFVLNSSLTVQGPISNYGDISIANGTYTNLQGEVSNQGILTIGGLGGSARVNLSGDTTFSGPGQTVMAGNSNTAIYGISGGNIEVLTIGAGHTLRGSGSIGAGNDINVVNRGIVRAEGSENLGVRLASTWDNTSGLIQVADGSTLIASKGVISGGTVQGLGATSYISSGNGSGGSISNATLIGTLSVAGGTTANLQGEISNQGTLTLAGSSSSGHAWVHLSGDTTFGGTGKTLMTGGVYAAIYGVSGGTIEVLTIGPGHTLQGAGSLGGGHADLINLGKMVISAGESMEVNTNRNALISQGIVAIENGATLRGAGEVFVQDANSALTNVDGLLSFQRIDLKAGILGGSGTIRGTVNAQGGFISPGNSPGLLTIDGDLLLDGDVSLDFDIAGSERGISYDAIDVSGRIDLGGTLKLVISPGFDVGDRFNILTAASGVYGSFERIVVDGYGVDAEYSISGISLRITEVLAVPEPATLMLWLLSLPLLSGLVLTRVRSGQG